MELLTQHWAQVLEYATLCTNSRQAANALARAAFRRQLASMAGQAGPSRYHLLGAVVEIAQEWDAGEGRSELREGLRSGPDGQEPLASVLRSNRCLLLHGFQQLPDHQQVLLWHIEVEAEDLAVAASHAGLDPDVARVRLHRARAELRAMCLQAHTDLAPDQDCCRYSRLIDVSVSDRQVTEFVPDLRNHLTKCGYCRAAAEQLDQIPERLPLLLAEAVLGFGADEYLAACRARLSKSAAVSTAEAPPGAVASCPPSVRAWDRRSRRVARRRARFVLSGIVGSVGLTGALLTVLLAGPGGDAGTGAAESAPPRMPPADNRFTPSLRAARFHNLGTDLCLDIGSHDLTAGAAAVTSTCAQAVTQLWELDPDGLLRSHADPGLCLNSANELAVQLRPCSWAGDGTWEFRYALSDDGLLIAGRNRSLAVTPAATRQAEGLPVVLRAPDASLPREFVRWRAETGT
ncbi:RICIN domain-containing protein [Streptomyces collinus]|uniref:RICIN domain-containing protein n=1 Tax=Streptomyces TaxID=1883 RepID=UPI0033D31ECA